MTRLVVLLTASAIFLANCSGSTTPASPSPASPMPSLAGIWVGSLSDPVAGEGGARLTLTEEPAGSGGFALQLRLVGTWAVTFRNGEKVEGRAEGYLAPGNNSDFYLALVPVPFEYCKPGSSGLGYYSLANAVVTSSRLTAALHRMTCVGLGPGSVSLIRQES